MFHESQDGQEKRHPVFLLLPLILLLACRSITIAVDGGPPAPPSDSLTRRIGFDFSGRAPSSPEGDTSASRHLFVHDYPVPFDGFITTLIYLNDSDKFSESFDLLILRPDQTSWTVMFRIHLSDDASPAETGTTVITLPYPLPVQRGDIFAHWQYSGDGAIPLNDDASALDGFSAGQYGLSSSGIEVGRRMEMSGFTGKRDYFINILFSTVP
ncbi:MAG: hypothetical protein HFACDABA_00457 [Anaerolineales bacterium]|nr:hypothetical protein [Anaerolineales bacterium]